MNLAAGGEAVEHGANLGVVAIGKSGDFTVEVLSAADGVWVLSIDTPDWCFDFRLSGQEAVPALAAFLRSHSGRTEFADLVVGTFSGMDVRVVKDDEFGDRFFLRAAGDRSLLEFTLVGDSLPQFAAALADAAADFNAAAE